MASSGSFERGRAARAGRRPGCPAGSCLEPEALAVPEQDGRRRAVDVEDEAGTGHQRLFSLRRSKATLTAPRRPALAACSMASR